MIFWRRNKIENHLKIFNSFNVLYFLIVCYSSELCYADLQVDVHAYSMIQLAASCALTGWAKTGASG